RYLGADRTAHLVDGDIERQALDGGAVDRGNAVARLDPGLGGRRTVDGRDHLDEAVFLLNLDAHAAEMALGRDLHVAIGFGVHIAGMRIEAGHHALDRGVDQFAVLDGTDVVGSYAL